MSTPDQPDSPPLTRRRLREIRATGANPVITPDGTPAQPEPVAPLDEPVVETPVDEDVASDGSDAGRSDAEESPASAPPVTASVDEPAPSSVPLARAAEPATVGPAPLPDADIDLGVTPLTRRQARAQERIRTASVPVIQPDQVPAATPAASVPQRVDAHDDPAEAESADREDAAVTASEPDPSASDEVAAADVRDDSGPDAADESETGQSETGGEESDHEPVSVDPGLGSSLLSGAAPAASIPPSFDQLIARSASSTGAISAPNALILSQTPSAAPLGPLSATGEILVTGSFDLPAGLGSVGHAHGAADGKELDAALIDGELPPASSPTPIAASAAVSTVRHAGEEIIRPPAPEKGNRLTWALVITAGVLALTLVGVLILVVTTGVL